MGLNYVFPKILQLSRRHMDGGAVGMQLMDPLGEKMFIIHYVCIFKKAKQNNCYKPWRAVLVRFTGSVGKGCPLPPL